MHNGFPRDDLAERWTSLVGRLRDDVPALVAVFVPRVRAIPPYGRSVVPMDRLESDAHLAFDGGKDGDEATFDLTDAGIPAGEYTLPYRWTERGGKSARARARFSRDESGYATHDGASRFGPNRKSRAGVRPSGDAGDKQRASG